MLDFVDKNGEQLAATLRRKAGVGDAAADESKGKQPKILPTSATRASRRWL